MKNGLDEQYIDLLKDILKNGVEKNTRNGKVLSVFGRTIRYKFKDGKFPLLTTKKLHFKSIVTELIWFLRGGTHIKFLHDNDCHIWDGDLYKNWRKQFEVDPNNFNGEEVAKGHNDQCWGYPILDHVKPTSKEYKRGQINAYLEGKAEKPFFYLTKEEFINKIKTDDEFAKKWGDLGKIYGHGWRNWNGEIDQISELIRQLKENPDSRRMVVSAWAVHDLPNMVLPPCHYGFQVYTRELSEKERLQILLPNVTEQADGLMAFGLELLMKKADEQNIPTRAISLMWNQRSVDTFLGLPFNIASYGLLLEIIAKAVNMVPDELIGNLGDVHLYSNHIEQAKEQIGRKLSLEERHQLALPIWKEKYGPLAAMMVMTNVDNTPYKIPRSTREPYPLPTLNINTEFWPYEGGECGEGPLDAIAVMNGFKDDHFCKCLLEADIQLSNYQSHPSIKAPLSN
jgi:thymidylate synthase